MSTSASNIDPPAPGTLYRVGDPMPPEVRTPLRDSSATYFRLSEKPAPLNSLVASAQRITSATVKSRRGFGTPEAWQDDAWDMFDLVGEQRFLATTLAGRLAQAKFYVGTLSTDPIEQPLPLEDEGSLPAKVLSYFGDSPQSRAQMILRMGINLFLPGDGYFVGIPRNLMPDFEGDAERPGSEEDVSGVSLTDLEWRMLSLNEVTRAQDRVVLKLGETTEEQINVTADEIFLIRVWRPHPRYAWKAESPTKASLPVLRELVGLTMHISAQVDSRLAGAGILVVPASARRAISVAAGIDPDLEDDPFTEALIEAMMTAISDRGSASALVPLVITVPDEATGLFQHITFATPLDSEARNLRDEAIRRLALGQDAPPELLLGVGGMNHWGAWLVREDVVTTHIEPPLALICDAITTQFLWPVLVEQGMSEEEARQHVVWYDVGHMVQRPNRLADAQVLHEKGVVSDETLRDAGGFSEEDAPENMSRSVEMAIEMAQANPALVDNLKEIIAAFEEVLNPTVSEATEIATTDAPEEGEDIVEEGTPGESEEAPAPGEEPSTEPPAGLARRFTPGAWSMIEELAQARGVSVDETVGMLFTSGADTSTQTYAPLDMDTSKTVMVAALPQADASVNSIGPEEPKHATIAFYGTIGEHIDPDAKESLMTAVGRAASATQPFSSDVITVAPLGDGGAQVWMLDNRDNPLSALFEAFEVEDNFVKATEAGVQRYPEFTPHVTIGYESAKDEAPAPENITVADLNDAQAVTTIPFNSIALFWGDEIIEFPLGTTN